MKKVGLLVLSTVMFLGSCELSNNAANKTNAVKKTNQNSTAQSKAAEESKKPYRIQWETDHAKMLTFIKANNLDTKWLNSGLYYTIIKPGSGTTPKAKTVVNVSYTVSDLDGNQIWSTAQSDGSETRGLSQFPEGVAEGLQLIQEGGHIQLIVPSGLAYGNSGWGKQIAPNTNLFYDMQLNSVQ